MTERQRNEEKTKARPLVVSAWLDFIRSLPFLVLFPISFMYILFRSSSTYIFLTYTTCIFDLVLLFMM